MQILIVGGTQFIGRHVVDALLRRGDDVTLFHRGKTNPALFPDVAHLHGDRNSDLSALAVGEWEATIDTSAYVPRQVRDLAHALRGRGGRYVHISSGSVYAHLAHPGSGEDAQFVTLDDPSTQEVTEATYGGLKYLCEQATHASFGPGGPGWSGLPSSIVRPTYVAGPHDHTGRFTWWVRRVARGGRVLAPEPRDNPFQVIDVRDVADFVARLAHGESQGVFHLAGPKPPFTFEDFLAAVRDVVGPPGCELSWVSAEALLAAGVTSRELPLWEGLTEDPYNHALDPSRAIAAGLSIRPIAETILDVHASELQPPSQGPAVGLSEVREQELLGLAEC